MGRCLRALPTLLVAVAAAGVLWLLGATLFDRSAPMTDAAGRGASSAVLLEWVGDPRDIGAKPVLLPGVRAVIPPPVDFALLDPKRDAHGIVVDEAGEAVPGASVAAVADPWADGVLTVDGHNKEVVGPTTTTSSDGTFALHLSRGSVVALRVAKGGFATLDRRGVVGGDYVRIVLRPAVRLTLRVEGPDGTPADGVAVRLRLVGAGGSGAGSRVGVTDAEGRVDFVDLPGETSATLQFMTSREGWGAPPPARLELPRTGEQTKTVRLLEGRTLRGVVRDAATQAPIAGARVGMTWALDGAVETDEEGVYVIPNWTGPGIRELHCLAAGYMRGAETVAERSEIDFALAAGAGVRGRVIDPAGRAIGGAAVAAIGCGPTYITSLANGWSDSSGGFELGGLHAGMPHTIVLTAAGHARMLYDVDAAGGLRVLELGDLVVRVGVEVEGRVQSDAGEPMAGVRVLAIGANADRTSRRADGTPAQTVYAHSHERWSDDLGRFRLPPLPPGSWTVRAEAEGAARVERSFEAGEVPDPPPLVLVLEATREVLVTVTDPEGAPVHGARVEWAPSTGGHDARALEVRAQTNERGEARVRLPRRSVLLQITPTSLKDLRLPPALEVAPNEAAVALRLERVGRIAGVLRGSEGPIAGALIHVRHGDHASQGLSTNEAGRFVVNLDGDEPVQISWDGLRTSHVPSAPLTVWRRADPVRARAGDEIELVAREVDADRSLNVRALAPDGSPLERVVHVSFHGSVLGNAATDERGVASFAGLPALEVSVSMQGEKAPIAAWLPPSSLQALPDGQTVVLQYRAGVWLEGVVVGPDGSTRPGVRVEASRSARRNEGQFHAQATADAEGRFRLVVDPAWADGVTLSVGPGSPSKQQTTLRAVRPTAEPVVVVLKD